MFSSKIKITYCLLFIIICNKESISPKKKKKLEHGQKYGFFKTFSVSLNHFREHMWKRDRPTDKNGDKRKILSMNLRPIAANYSV